MKKLNLNNLQYNFELGRTIADQERLKQDLPLFERGKCCFIIQKHDFLWENYKRKDLCLKVFMDPPIQTNINDYYWGAAPNEPTFEEALNSRKISKLQDSIEAQKICFKHGLAPEVVDLIIVEKANKEYPCLITQYIKEISSTPLSSKQIKELLSNIQKILDKNFKMPYHRLVSYKDFVNKKLVDFQGFQKI